MIQDMDLTITQQRKLATGTFEMTLSATSKLPEIQPGQFVNVQLPDSQYPLRRPFGISEVLPSENSIKLIYRVVGQGTELMAQLQTGTILPVLGPLGHGFPIDFLPKQASVLIVSGGTGLPPLYELAKTLAKAGHRLDIALGFPTKARVFYESEMRALGHTEVITDDGSYGAKGIITDLLDQPSFQKTYQAVYACGPKALESAVMTRYKSHPHAYISAEARMACGIGICNACVLHTPDNGVKKVCTDGPVFHVSEVIL